MLGVVVELIRDEEMELESKQDCHEARFRQLLPSAQ